MDIERTDKRHSFTLVSNGFRLVFKENERKYPQYGSCFGITSFDNHGNYAQLGIGKAMRNDSTSFTNGVEKEMLHLEQMRKNAEAEIAYLQRKLKAINDFLDFMPKLMLEDGLDTIEEDKANGGKKD